MMIDGVLSVNHIVKNLMERFIRSLCVWWDEVGVKLWDKQVGRQVVEKQNTQKWKKRVEKTEGFQDFLS